MELYPILVSLAVFGLIRLALSWSVRWVYTIFKLLVIAVFVIQFYQFVVR